MKIPFRKSIGFRLLGISILLFSLPLLINSFVVLQKQYEWVTARAKSYLVEAANLRELPLSELKPVHQPLLTTMIHFLDVQENFPQTPDAEINTKLERIASIGDFYGVFLLNFEEGDQLKVVGSSLPSYVGREFADFLNLNAVYFKAFDPHSQQMLIYFHKQTFEPYFIVAERVYGADKTKPLGVIAISEKIGSKLNAILTTDTHYYKANFALMVPSTIIIASGDPKLRFQYLKPLSKKYKETFIAEEPFAAKELPEAPLAVDHSIEKPFFEFEWEGERQIGYIKEIPNTTLYLLSYASYDNIFETPRMLLLKIAAIYLFILAIGGVLATLLTWRMVRPIQKLGEVMYKIQEGDLQERYRADPLGFEVNLLGHIFNGTIDTLLEKKNLAKIQRIKKESFAKELRLGRQVQRRLLPEVMPEYPQVDLAEVYIPAIEVGGDFYDVQVRPQGELVLTIADASGKGVSACLYSLILRNILRTYARQYDNVAHVMAAANNLFCSYAGSSGMFVTAAMVMYDQQTQQIRYYSFGHNPMYLRRVNGEVEVLNHLDRAIGLLPMQEYPNEQSCQLYPGDMLLLYTDGVTEAHNSHFEQFGEERLMAQLSALGDQSAQEAIALIVEAVNTFVGTAPQHDDITMVMMRIEP